MSRALFISDLHISSAADPKYALFLRVLEHCQIAGIQELFLVGDIFDLWISDQKFFVEEYHAACAKIRQLHSDGMRIHYFEGNHDLDLQRYWGKQLGLQVHADARHFTINGLKFRVEHGDLMDPGDHGYLFLRWLLRTPLLLFMQRHFPSRLVQWIGLRASQKSRNYTTYVKTSTDEQVQAKVIAHAQKQNQLEPFDIFVSGHVHVHLDTGALSPGTFRAVNLGTWLKVPMVFFVDDQKMELKTVDEFLN